MARIYLLELENSKRIMQTFIPYPDFKKSAEVLDHQNAGKFSRSWKQVVEVYQLLMSLRPQHAPTHWDSWFENIPHLKDMFPVVRYEELSEAELTLVNHIHGENWADEWVLKKCYQGGGGYTNHPARTMWQENVDALCHYYNIFLHHNKTVNKVNTYMVYIQCEFSGPLNGDYKQLEIIREPTIDDMPWWYVNEDIFRSHRSRLIEKSPNYYNSLFPGDEGFNQSMYIWPRMTDRTYYLAFPPWDPDLVDNSAYKTNSQNDDSTDKVPETSDS